MFPNNRIQKHCRQKNILTLSLIFSSTSSSSSLSLSPSSSLSSLSSSSFCENLASPKKSFPSAIVAPRPRLLATRHAHFMKCDPTVIPVAWKTLSHAHTLSLFHHLTRTLFILFTFGHTHSLSDGYSNTAHTVSLDGFTHTHTHALPLTLPLSWIRVRRTLGRFLRRFFEQFLFSATFFPLKHCSTKIWRQIFSVVGAWSWVGAFLTQNCPAALIELA